MCRTILGILPSVYPFAFLLTCSSPGIFVNGTILRFYYCMTSGFLPPCFPDFSLIWWVLSVLPFLLSPHLYASWAYCLSPCSSSSSCYTRVLYCGFWSQILSLPYYWYCDLCICLPSVSLPFSHLWNGANSNVRVVKWKCDPTLEGLRVPGT